MQSICHPERSRGILLLDTRSLDFTLFRLRWHNYMRETRFEGIVIGYENWGDVDRLISFYTPHFGKLEVVAKGVRYEKSKLKGHLEILSHGQFMLAQNKGRGVLIDAQSHETFAALRHTPEKAVLGRSIADMYDAYLFTHAPDEALWQTLFDFLSELLSSGAETQPAALIANFAANFLRHLGYLDTGAHSRAKDGTSLVKDAPSAQLRAYDNLLYHTDISGPTFSNMLRAAEALREHALASEPVYTR